jgi:hypothetical protein
MARAFDVIIGHPYMFKHYVAAMKAANPSLELVVYVNGLWGPERAFPEEYYARDAQGRKVRWIPFGTYLMDPRSGWPTQLAQNCEALLAQSGFDRCFFDSMGASPVSSLGDKTGAAIDPATGEPWERNDWLSASRDTIAHARAIVNDSVAANGIAAGRSYFARLGPTRLLAEAADDVMVEQFVRSPGDPVDKYRNVRDWQQDVEMMIDAQRRGASVLAVTKVWTDATQAQRDAWHKYALTTFLLGTDGSSRFSFLNDDGPLASTYDHPWDRGRLGWPKGDYAQIGGTFQRAFARGRVVVNPTTNPMTVNLPAGVTYMTLDKRQVSGTLTLPPHSGESLRIVAGG